MRGAEGLGKSTQSAKIAPENLHTAFYDVRTLGGRAGVGFILGGERYNSTYNGEIFLGSIHAQRALTASRPPPPKTMGTMPGPSRSSRQTRKSWRIAGARSRLGARTWSWSRRAKNGRSSACARDI